MQIKTLFVTILFSISTVMFPFSVHSESATTSKLRVSKKQVIDHWTPERRQQAIPRDLLIDSSGKAFIKGRKGELIPYGLSADHPKFNRKPGTDSKDSTPPSITNMDPVAGTTIGNTYTFSAEVTDTSGVRSAEVIINFPGGNQTQSFSATADGNTWSVTLQGFTDGAWSWQMKAKDGSSGKGITAISEPVSFNVDVNTAPAEPGTGSSGTVSNAPWSNGGAIQYAAGRLYFEMPSNRTMRSWNGYVCSGTVTSDGVTGRSLIITAAHCVYDDVNKAFARNVLFIPNQDGTEGTGTDLNCSNDPIGCWVPSFGVVDDDWTSRTFPDNIPWDYAFYVVDDASSHQAGLVPSSDILDQAVSGFNISFNPPIYGEFTHALGYSYSEDPNFMYCAEDLGTEGSYNWWLASCGLSGGSSGGPWIQTMDETSGTGSLISVNSWGYTTSPGMAGPILSGTSAGCVFAAAQTSTPGSNSDGNAGLAAACP